MIALMYHVEELMNNPKSAGTIGVQEVTIDDDFWSPRVRTNKEATIEYQYKQLKESGSLQNFRRVRDGKKGGFSGMWFQDSDVYKWIEATSYVFAANGESSIEKRLDEVISLITEAQREDGYVNTYFSLVEPDERWTNLHMMHELYCAGHLIEAAVAHYTVTGKETLLNVATKLADHIDEVFGETVDGVAGHQEIELALLRLYRVSGTDRYLDLAEYFIDLRGKDDRLEWEIKHPDEIGGANFDDWEDVPGEELRELFLDDGGEYDGRYAQAHAPLQDQKTVEGHSVRAMYFYTAAAELALETGDHSLVNTLESLWDNMTSKRMYLTGGIGSSYEHEGFTEDYDLPNETAYAETCAAVGNIFWNQRMFELTGEVKYVHLIERTLYNGFLAGISLDGTKFFYENLLESSGDHHRKGWFTCACCPPNAARLLASLQRYIYSKREGELYVNQYIGSSVQTTIEDQTVELKQTSQLPWEGKVTLSIDAEESVPVNLRIPQWTNSIEIQVNGNTVVEDSEDYVTLEREWSGDNIELQFEQSITQVQAHPAVDTNACRTAFTRGPLVYAAEGVDHERPLYQHSVVSDGDWTAKHQEELLDGVTTLDIESQVPDLSSWEGDLYLPYSESEMNKSHLHLVPYYTWDNRAPGEMRVWHRTKES